MTQKKPKRGRKPLPADMLRVPWSCRLPQGLLDEFRAVCRTEGEMTQVVERAITRHVARKGGR